MIAESLTLTRLFVPGRMQRGLHRLRAMAHTNPLRSHESPSLVPTNASKTTNGEFFEIIKQYTLGIVVSLAFTHHEQLLYHSASLNLCGSLQTLILNSIFRLTLAYPHLTTLIHLSPRPPGLFSTTPVLNMPRFTMKFRCTTLR